MRNLCIFLLFLLAKAICAQEYMVRVNKGVEKVDITKGIARKIVNHPNSLFDEFIYLKGLSASDLDSLVESGLIAYWEDKRVQTLHYLPSDSLLDRQWYIERVQATKAWDIFKGDSSYFVGIVDSGVDYEHQDLQSQLAYNDKDPINGIDDDLDGYVDNYYGWDFGQDDNIPFVDPGTVQAHGQSICGIVASKTDNGIGTASLGFHCKYLPVKITNESGLVVNTNEAMIYAALAGAKVINCSFGSHTYSQAEADIINLIVDSLDVLVVASAGNEGQNIAVYPAALSNVLGVCAVDEQDVKVPVSNYGTYYDLSAPGTSIYCPIINNQYAYKSGTSVSAAVVSSAAILLRSYFVNETAAQIKQRIVLSSDPIENDLLGSGRLNLYEAFNYEPSRNNYIHIYPNPSNGSFNLSFLNLKSNTFQLSVYDVLGNLYHREDFSNSENLLIKEIELTNLRNGYYIVVITSSSFNYSSGIIIVK